MSQILPSTILRNAKELILDEGSWCQHAISYDIHGSECDPCDPLATCWCSIGAVMKTGGYIQFDAKKTPKPVRLLNKAVIQITSDADIWPADYNDTHTHAEVMAMFAKAIALAEAEEQKISASALD